MLQGRERQIQMKDILLLVFNIFIALYSFGTWTVYSEGVQSIMKKEKRWFIWFLIWGCMLLFISALYSWLPGRAGFEINIMDGVFVLEDGMFFKNLAMMLFAQTLGIVIIMWTHIWRVIRKKERFSGAFLLLQLVIGAGVTYLGTRLFQNDQKVVFQGGEKTGYAVLYLMTFTGAVMIILGIISSRKNKKSSRSKNSGK